MINLPTKFKVSISTHYEDMKSDSKCAQEALLSPRDPRRETRTTLCISCIGLLFVLMITQTDGMSV